MTVVVFHAEFMLILFSFFHQESQVFLRKVSYLCTSQKGGEFGLFWAGLDETVELEGNHRTWIEAQRAGVLRKITQDVLRVKETHLQTQYVTYKQDAYM